MAKPIPFPMKGRSSVYTQASALIPKGENTGPDFAEGWFLSYGSITDQEILSEIHELKEQVKNLQSQLEKAFVYFQPTTEEKEMITLRDLSLAGAKEEIALYFREHDGKNIDYDELISKLRIEPLTVIQACTELEEEGKIG